jgi:preprotein translocase subunit YajC
LAAGLLAAAPANATLNAPAKSKAVTAGMQVVDVAGKPVGTVQSVRGTELILKTDRHTVRLPVGSFTPDKGRLVFGMSREALNRETDALLAAARTNLLPGSEVRGRNGALAGYIESLNNDFVTLKLTSGESIRLPRNSIAARAKSAVLGITVPELQAMAKQALATTE